MSYYKIIDTNIDTNIDTKLLAVISKRNFPPDYIVIVAYTHAQNIKCFEGIFRTWISTCIVKISFRTK